MLLPDDSVGAVNISTNKDILTLSSQQNVIIHNLNILFTRTPEVVILGGYGSVKVKEWFLVVTKKIYWTQLI